MTDKPIAPVETPLFTEEDAQRLLDAARAAPLVNMQAASELADIIIRFRAFFGVATHAFKIVQIPLVEPPAPPPDPSLVN